MIDMLFNFLPQWLALYKTPMSPASRQWWEKARKLGCALFVILVTLGLGGGATVVDFCCGMLARMARNHAAGGWDIRMHFVWWFSGALIVGVGEWFSNESRFRLPPRADASNELGSTRLESTVL